MPFLLADRDTESKELMDDEDCALEDLINTYRQFSTINSLISGWKKIYNTHLKPRMGKNDRRYSLLDIGFGGGDIPIKLNRWAESDKIKLDITAIETDLRALEFVQSLKSAEEIEFKYCSSTKMLDTGRQFDFVISNHLIHHLNRAGLKQLLVESEKLSKGLVIFNDIERWDIGYVLFNLFARPVFRSSFITHDGLTSIKRSYTLNELRERAPDDWKVERLFPFRLLLSYDEG